MYSASRKSKPWPGVGIDWTNPLAQGLQFAVPFNEGSGSPYEIINRVVPSSIAHMGWGSGIDGWAATFDGTNSTIAYPAPAFPSLPGITVLVRFSTAALSSNQYLLYRVGGWNLNFAGGVGYIQWSGNGAARSSWPISGISANTWYTVAVTDLLQSNAGQQIYINGVPVTTSQSNNTAPANSASNIYVGSFQASSNWLNGSVSLALVWNRGLTAKEVDQVSVNPWQLFQPAWPRGLVIRTATSFTITEDALPTHHPGGPITVHAVGINTNWTSGTTFSVSGVTGWAVASQTYVDGTHFTLVLSCPSSGGASGTLIVSDGLHSTGIGVSTAAMTCSPSTISAFDSVSVTFTGTNTVWSVDNPTFTIAGGSGATIGELSVSTNTSATATVYAGSAAGATLTVTDPSTGATTTLSTPSSVTTTAYVTRSGRLVAFVFGTSANAATPITAVNSLPTFKKNGSTISCLGPFWDMTTQTDPFLFFQLPSQVASTDIVTFAASAGWVTTGAGNSTVYDDGLATNYTGSFEAPLFGCVPFDYLPKNTNGLQVGFNAGFLGFETYALEPGCPQQNWFKRGSWVNPSGTIGSSTADGRPITISAANGTVKLTAANYNYSNCVDNLSYPELVGTWTFVADDTNPSAPMLVGATFNTNGITVLSGPTTPSAPTRAGTLSNGVLVGQTWQWTVAFKASPTSLYLDFVLAIQTNSGSSGNYTLTNEYLFAPNGNGGGAPSLDRTNPARSDENFLAWMTVGNKGSASLRSSLGGFNGAQSNMVNPSDFFALSDCLWSGVKVTNTGNITSIRAYTLGNSPNLYFAGPFLGTSVNSEGSGNTAYYYAPSSIDFTDFTNLAAGGQYFVGECVCSEAHNLNSGQFITWGGTMPTVSVTQGSGDPIDYTFGTSADSGYNGTKVLNFPIFVTSSTTFMFWGYCGGTTKGTLVANTLATTYDVPGGSPFTASVTLPDTQVPPPEIMAQAAASVPGCAGIASVPVIATDATAEYIANIWLSYLPPGRLCYVEVGNEPWNGSFWQGEFFNGLLCNMAGAPFAGLGQFSSTVLRAMQVANNFRTVWGAKGRAGSIRSWCNMQAVGVSDTQTLVSTLNTYNAANPGAPFQLDAIAVAPYIDVVTDQQPSPAAQATVSVGGSGGSLSTGTYYAAYTYVDSLTGYESAVGTSESAQFTIASSGQVATITFNDTMPATVASRNLYLTAANGAKGSEVLYHSGVTASTYACSAAVSGSTTPLANSLAPSYSWGAASIAASNSNSIANSSVNPGNPYASNPWTY
ncbi:MAG: LamG-like jellyroll fold domain-containing protein, partial [Isosphaeraceae bacterium]